MIHSIMQHWDEQHSVILQHIADVTLGLSAHIDRGAGVGNINACNPKTDLKNKWVDEAE